MNQALMTIESTVSLAEHFVKSGFFKDVRDVSKAVVKMTYGRELGLGSGESLQGIYFVEGKLTLAAHTMGAMIQRSEKYDYLVLKSTNTECHIEFSAGEKEVGTSIFTIEDAKRAGLAGKNTWQKYPKAMLFSRALSQGARMYCPEVFGGAVYVEGEIEESVVVQKPDREMLAVESVGQGKGAPAFLEDEPLPENREDDGDGLTDIKEVFDAQVIDPDLIPKYDDDKPVDVPTEKQLTFLETLLVNKGVQTRHVPELVQECLDGNVNKETVRYAISDIKDRPCLPSGWTRAYTKILRTEKGLSLEDIIAHLTEEYDIKDPAAIPPAKVRDFFDWINTYASPDNAHEFGVKTGELSEAEMNWLRWVDGFCSKYELPEDVVESYIDHKFGDHKLPETLEEIKKVKEISIYRAIRDEYLQQNGEKSE